MSGRLPRLPGVVATLDTAGEGYFVGVSVVLTNTPGTGEAVSVADQVRAFQFVLPFRAVVRKITTEVTTLEAGQLYNVAIFSADRNTLLVETGALTTASAAVIETSVTAVTLEPGVYWFAQTADTSTTVVFRTIGFGAVQINWLNAGSVEKGGVAANTSSSAVFPSTLGAISASTAKTPIAAVFSP